MNQSKLPDDLGERLDACGDAEAIVDVAVDAGTLLCERLLAAGVPGLHLYVLNRSDAAKRVLQELDL
jgi:methylenetetrahydrofolate reductase (NADPH)